MRAGLNSNTTVIEIWELWINHAEYEREIKETTFQYFFYSVAVFISAQMYLDTVVSIFMNELRLPWNRERSAVLEATKIFMLKPGLNVIMEIVQLV